MSTQKTSLPRMTINLARSLDAVGDEPPTAGTVAVTFDAATGAVTLPTNADVDVNKNKMKVLFDLTAQNVPVGAAAVIQGIEFMKPNEPSGTFAASSVFEDSGSFTDQNGTAHTVYGKWQQGQSELKLVDDNNVGTAGTEQDYGYKVWVKLTLATGTPSYYASPDPQVINKPTT